MRRYQNFGMIFLAASLVAAIVVSCTRQTPPLVSPLPVYTSTITSTPLFTSTITNSPTQTNSPTPVFSPTFTTSPTNTSTPTSTSSPTNTTSPTSTFTITSTGTSTETPTVTNTGTQTLTPTITDSPTGTSTITLTDSPTISYTPTITPTITDTPAVTSTITQTPTITSTPGITLTAFANVVACSSNPATFQSSYDFTNGIQCWSAKMDSGPNYIVQFGTTSMVQHNGHYVLCISVNNTSGSTVKVDIVETLAAGQVIAGAGVTGYISLDAGLVSGSTQAACYNQDPTYTKYDAANCNYPSATTAWAAVWDSPVTNTTSINIGFQVFNIPAGAQGNIYLADVAVNVPVVTTPTITLTPNGNTPTVTSTPITGSTPGITLTPYPVAPCGSAPASYQAAYDFTAGTQCWTGQVDNGTNYVTGFGTTNLVQHNGHSVLAVSVGNPTGSPVTVKIDFILAISTSQVLTSGSITGYVMMDPNLISASPQAMAYNISGATPLPAYNYDNGNNNWPAVTSTGWAQVTQSSVVNTDTQQVGFQAFNVAIPAGASGNIYLADVALNIPTGPSNTPTITPTPGATSTPGGAQGYVFNSASAVSAWYNNTYATAALINPVSILYNSIYTGCLSGSTGAMEVTLGFTASGQAAFIQNDFSTATDLSGKTITAIMDVTSGWNSDAAQIYGGVFAQEGGSNDGIGAAYSEDNLTAGFWSTNSIPTNSGCVTVSLTLPTTGTSGGFDPTHVSTLGIQIGSGSGGTSFPVTAVVDISEWIYQ